MMPRNPFSTRYIRPGAMPFVFPSGQSQSAILKQFETPWFQGAILGPHGSGKSTLLESLSEDWRLQGLNEQRVRLTAARRRESIPMASLNENFVLVIDGFEQLSYWRQRWVRWRCWQKKAKLLVTCHAECGLPIVLRTEPTWELAFDLVRVLLACDVRPYESDLRAIWEESPGDIRAYFFRLYHWCESQRISQSSGCLPDGQVTRD